MSGDHQRFPDPVQKRALARQLYHCASCETHIAAIGKAGQRQHEFREGAEGHHVIPHKMGGPLTEDNCVVLCKACHMSAHQGARYRDVSIYSDLQGLTMPQKIAKIAALYPHYLG